MRTQYTNLVYDPQRQGFDSSVWRTLYGEPVVNGGYLRLYLSSIIHYGDALRGEVSMVMNVATTPVAGENKQFGLKQINKGAYLLFDITNSTFSAKASDGTNSSSSTITWDTTNWTGAYVKYTIRWEAGTARFLVNDVQQAVITSVAVPGDPLGFFLLNDNTDVLSLSSLNAKLHSYYLNEALEDTSLGRQIYEGDRITISESVTMTGQLGATSISDQLNITESITRSGQLGDTSVNDQLNITESVTNSGQLGATSKSDQLDITESVTMLVTGVVSVSDQLDITESVTMFLPLLLLATSDVVNITDVRTVGAPA